MSHRAQIIRGASRSTYIRTVPTDGGLKAWHLRDFVKALDAAGIPDDARLECHKDTGTLHFSGVSVRHTEDIEGWPEQDEAEPCASCDGARWVDDENWQPDREELAAGRMPGAGRIPCGICNHGGWDVPDAATSSTSEEP